MIKRKGKYTFIFSEPPCIKGAASVAGEEEEKGPLGNKFDKIIYGCHGNQDTFEQAESLFQKEALGIALEKSKVKAEETDVLFAGDLLNQCAASSYGASAFSIPFAGQYGACSTSAQAIIMGAVFVASNAANIAAAVTSSHFCSAERQFRFPLEYGAVRTPTSQRTVTGAGAFIIGKKERNLPFVSAAVLGKTVDMGITDANNMGAAMAPAAADTLKTFFEDTNTSAKDFDGIYTGDLGEVGSEILAKLMKDFGYDISGKHKDCGMLIYDRVSQDVHSGGSGCGCGAAVLAAHILPKMLSKEESRVLYIATGALLSTTTGAQGATIPCVAHLIELGI